MKRVIPHQCFNSDCRFPTSSFHTGIKKNPEVGELLRSKDKLAVILKEHIWQQSLLQATCTVPTLALEIFRVELYNWCVMTLSMDQQQGLHQSKGE